MKKATKDFDCVEMKRQGARKVQAELKGLTFDEQVAYWKARTDAFLKKYGVRTREGAKDKTPFANAHS